MYQIEIKDLHDAARIMHRFMTNKDLTRPECSIWKSKAHLPITLTNMGMDFMSEEEFCQMIETSEFVMVACVASTDKADKRRAVLAMMAGMDYLNLNFPHANGRPNSAEKRLVSVLSA